LRVRFKIIARSVEIHGRGAAVSNAEIM